MSVLAVLAAALVGRSAGLSGLETLRSSWYSRKPTYVGGLVLVTVGPTVALVDATSAGLLRSTSGIGLLAVGVGLSTGGELRDHRARPVRR